MVPYKDMYNSTNILSDDEYDLLTPLQLLKGNSLSDLMLNDDVFIQDELIEGPRHGSRSDRTGIIVDDFPYDQSGGRGEVHRSER